MERIRVRPRRVTPLLGSTGWRIVRTNAPETHPAHVFYYHHASHTSSWTMPAVLAPFDLSRFLPAAAAPAADDGAPAAKRAKPLAAGRGQAKPLPPPPPRSAADVAAAVDAFKAMLLEAGITPFSEYTIMAAALAGDPRFAAVADDDDRRAIFEAVAIEAAARKAERARGDAGGSSAEQQSPADAFRALVARTLPQLPPAASLYDLRAVAADDPAYTGVSKLERETLFAAVVDAARQDAARAKAEKKAEKKAAKKAYLAALAALHPPLTADSTWRATAPLLKASGVVARVGKRKAEDYFYDYVDGLREAGRGAAKVAAATRHAQHAGAVADLDALLAEFVKSPVEPYASIADRLADDPRWYSDAITDTHRADAVARHQSKLAASGAGRLDALLDAAFPSIRLDATWDEARAALGTDARVAATDDATAAVIFEAARERAVAAARAALLDMVDAAAPYGTSVDAAAVLAQCAADPRLARVAQAPGLDAAAIVAAYVGSAEQAARHAEVVGAQARTRAKLVLGDDGASAAEEAYGEVADPVDALLDDDDDDDDDE